MKKYLILILVTTFSFGAFAITNEELAKVCLDRGITKVSEQAAAYGCSIDISKIEVQDIDNRWYNPSKYIWYQVMGECNNSDRVIKLVQYYNGKCI